MTDIDIETLSELQDAEAKEKARNAAKPVIDHLPDAVGTDELGNPTFLAGAGDRIIIERYATVLSHKPWLDTKTYVITNVDGVTGDLVLMDTDLGQQAGSNYITGTKAGYRFKLPNSKGMSIGKRKRGRPRKNPTGIPEQAKPVELDAEGKPVIKKRGRPKGSKNRDKAIIKAEKKAKLEARKVKKAKKK
jgi:hypothetical protein